MNIQHYLERFKIQYDIKLPMRSVRIGVLKAFLDGSVYDNLAPFHQEFTGSIDTYIPLVKRRPSVTYNLCKKVVDESTSMLFGKEHFPKVKSGDDDTDKFLEQISKKLLLNRKMLLASKTGSVGSVALLVRLLNTELSIEILDTQFLLPVFSPSNPDTLIGVQEKYKIKGRDLMSNGYKGLLETEDYYFLRTWDLESTTYYLPFLPSEELEENFRPKLDLDLTVIHNLGILPIVWIKNMESLDPIDGECTFWAAIDASVEISYQLSQLGRMLRYNSDPTLVIKNPDEMQPGNLIKNHGAIVLGEDGDAKYLEISSGATEAVLEYVKANRDFAIETVRGNRINPDKIHATASGKALEILNASLISLVDELRISYGDALLEIYKIVLKIASSEKVNFNDVDTLPGKIDLSSLQLIWPDWYPDTPQDRLTNAQAIKILKDAAVISGETATNASAADYDIQNTEDELKNIDAEQAELYSKGEKITDVIQG